MNSRDYFPLGLADGKGFCDRVQETTTLLDNLKSGKHTWLVAPRRYGKSSLAVRALRLSHLPNVEIDFYMASSERVVESYILAGVADLIGKAIGSVDKLIQVIKDFVKHLNVSFSFKASHMALQLTANPLMDPATNIKEALLLLEGLLVNKKKQAILLFDEFQTIGLLSKGTGVEAAIRHVAQKTKYLTFIFSGSHRRMLQRMFEDESRPLYQLCYKMQLKRISAEYYSKHIQKAANLAWKKMIPAEVVTTFFMCSQRHPYYINKLCDRIFATHSQLPSKNSILQAWEDIIQEDKSEAIKELLALSAQQKRVLELIAKGVTTGLTEKKHVQLLGISSSGIVAILDALEDKDLIERNENTIRIINPIIHYYAVSHGVVSV